MTEMERREREKTDAVVAAQRRNADEWSRWQELLSLTSKVLNARADAADGVDAEAAKLALGGGEGGGGAAGSFAAVVETAARNERKVGTLRKRIKEVDDLELELKERTRKAMDKIQAHHALSRSRAPSSSTANLLARGAAAAVDKHLAAAAYGS